MTAELKRFWIVFTAVAALILGCEAVRWTNDGSRAEALQGYLCGKPADWAPFLPLFALAPIAYGIVRRRGNSDQPTASTSTAETGARATAFAWLLAFVCAGTAFGISRWAGTPWHGSPPAYHDEFSYLFQAQTFAAGRLSYPSFGPKPELFDQMHVLNEGQFASRYFPGAGAWFALFLKLGDVTLAPSAAAAVLAFCVFWTGRQLSTNGVGFLAGLLCGLSPGLTLFSTTFLAHHPTLVGLGVFLVGITRLRARPDVTSALLAGTGLSFAMLCRPMTAAGFALPWGIWFSALLLGLARPVQRKDFKRVEPRPVGSPAVRHSDAASDTGTRTLDLQEDASKLEVQTGPSKPGFDRSALPLRKRLALLTAMGGPLLVGFVILFTYNRSITGSGATSPYQLYTDLYTPRHVYGFNNVVRGEQKLGPKVLENYDHWAENLTPSLAVRNECRRIVASGRWTFGLVPLAFALFWFLLGWRSQSNDWRLVAAGVVSLHVAHIPYWFEGIMGWHYVFESAPLLLLLFAESSRQLLFVFRSTGHRTMGVWWMLLAGTAAAVNLVPLPPLWPGLLQTGLSELAFSRNRYAQFDQEIARRTAGRPAVLLIEPDPADRHIDYVYNAPSLDTVILRARVDARTTDFDAVADLFPDRDVYQVRIAPFEWKLLRRAQARR